MDARLLRAAVMAALAWSSAVAVADAASHRSRHFLVTAPTPELARQVAEAAEEFRRTLALDWLGAELPEWPDVCPIHVTPRGGAGGQTQFTFIQGRPRDWKMSIQGSPERILDSVLPHEVLHMVFASHFGQGLPRWADEGACTTVEHISERSKQIRLLYECLTTDRGIAFNQMFAMREYPQDMLPLYAQGFALTRFLIAVRGKRPFVEFVGEGLKTNNWTAAVRRYYGFESLSQLQLHWLEWIRQGGREEVALQFFPATAQQAIASTQTPAAIASPEVAASPSNSQASPAPIPAVAIPPAPIASAPSADRLVAVPPTSDLPARLPVESPTDRPTSTSLTTAMPTVAPAPVASFASFAAEPSADLLAKSTAIVDGSAGHYAKTRDAYRAARGARDAAPDRAVARPQPPEKAREVVIEWSRPAGAPYYSPGSTATPIYTAGGAVRR